MGLAQALDRVRDRRCTAARPSAGCGCRRCRTARRCARDTGTCATSGVSGRSSCSISQRRTAPAQTETTTSLTVAPCVVLDRLELARAELAEDEAPVRRDAPVEHRLRRDQVRRARRRRGRSTPATLRERAHAGEDRRTACPRGSGSPSAARAASAPGSAGAPSSPSAEHLQRRSATGRRGRRPRRRRDLAALGREVEQQRHDLRAGQAVDDRVVDLGQNRDEPGLVTLDHVELPQRPRAVQRPRHDPRHLVGELLRRCPATRAPSRARGSRGRSRPPRPSTGGRARAGPRPAASAAAAAAAPRSAISRVTCAQPNSPLGRRRRVEHREAAHVARLAEFSRARNCASRLVSCRMRAHYRTRAIVRRVSPSAGTRPDAAQLVDLDELLRRVPPPARRAPSRSGPPATAAHRSRARSPKPTSWPSARRSAATEKRRGSTGRCSSRATRTRCRSRRSTPRSAVFSAHGIDVRVDADDGYTPTPALSHAILTHPGSDGIVLTPSHNPPEDGGYKYNPPSGGPAGTDDHEGASRRRPTADRRRPDRNRRRTARRPHDYVDAYVEDLPNVIDIDAIRDAGRADRRRPAGRRQRRVLQGDRRDATGSTSRSSTRRSTRPSASSRSTTTARSGWTAPRRT